MPSRLSQFTDRLVTLAKRAVSGDPSPSVKKGDGGYADWVVVVIHGLREYLALPYRRLLDVLHEMHGIVEKMNLEMSELPDFTTVCARRQQLKMAVWRTLLRLSAIIHDTGDVQAIDATGFDRYAASRHYANRTDYTFRSVKATALVDCETRTVLDIHCSMKQPHDTHVGRQVLTRNLDRLQTVTADKGYDWDDLREELREADVRPVIKHRKFYPLDMAHNAPQYETVPRGALPHRGAIATLGVMSAVVDYLVRALAPSRNTEAGGGRVPPDPDPGIIGIAGMDVPVGMVFFIGGCLY